MPRIASTRSDLVDARPGTTQDGGEPASPHAPGERRPLSRSAVLVAVATALGVAALLYGVLPRVAGVREAWQRFDEADSAWLAGAVVFELASFTGYVVLLRAMLGEGVFGWRASVLITLAGVAATRLLATGGAGGIALTAWVLRRAGRSGREATAGVTGFLVALYAFFMAALVIVGVGLWSGALTGAAPVGLTLVPGIIGAAVIVGALGLALVDPGDGRPIDGRSHGWPHRAATRLRVAGGVLGSGVRQALELARGRDPRLLGAAAWWAFDIAALWACLHAFSTPPGAAPLVMAYFVGMLGNLLPLPGGVGGVDGAMIGALIGFGVDPGAAVVGVLAYRVVAFWLPTLAGIPAYLLLLRLVRGWTTAPP